MGPLRGADGVTVSSAGRAGRALQLATGALQNAYSALAPAIHCRPGAAS